MTSARWRSVAWLLALGAAAAGSYVYYQRRAGEERADLKLDTEEVTRGPVTAKVTATGTLSALVTVQVGSQVSGRLQEILVDFNSPVEKGQVIARIDPQLFRAALEQARANFAAAKANLTRSQAQALDARRQAQRAQALAEQKLGPEADAMTADATANAADAQVAASRAAVEQAQASLHQAQINLNYTTIASPIHGVVISRNVDVGQTVAASLQAPVLFVIAEDLRKMQVDSSVSEADVGKLRPGMDATFTVDAFPTEKFVGKVRQIRNAPQTLQNVVTYDAVIDVDNPDLKLRPGMTAAVTFVCASRPDAVRVPNAALRFRPSPALVALLSGKASKGAGPGETSGARERPAASQEAEGHAPNERSVWVMHGDKPKRSWVHIGITDGSVTEIVDGSLSVGDKVVVDAPEPEVTKPTGRSPFRMM